MKIYGCPIAVPDYKFGMDFSRIEALEDEHAAKLKTHLIDIGYGGENTGRIVNFPIGDGYATYMVAEAARKFALIHVPYGDGYSYPYIERLTKNDIMQKLNDGFALAGSMSDSRAKLQSSDEQAPTV